MNLPSRRTRISVLLIALAVTLAVFVVRRENAWTDDDRAANVERVATDTVFRDRVEPRWLPGNTRFWYDVTTGPGTREYVLVDAEKGVRTLAFDHERLARALQAAGERNAKHDQLALSELEWTAGNTLAFTLGPKRWRVSLETYEVLPAEEIKRAPTNTPSSANWPTASQRTGPSSPLRFFNRTAGLLRMFWLDFEGKRRAYGTVADGEVAEQGTYGGHVWLLTNRSGEIISVFEAPDKPSDAWITDQKPGASATTPRPTVRIVARDQSPDGKWSAQIRDHNVVLRETATGRETTLTTDGLPQDAYRDAFSWSPDSKKLQGVRVRPGAEHKVAFVESSPATQTEPRLHTYNYYKPGDALPHPRPALWDIETKRQIPIDDASFSQPFTENETLDTRWDPDSSRFMFRYNQRGHQVLRMISIDASSGQAGVVVDERSKTFITHSSDKAYSKWLDDTGELIWMSERDGWNHLYLYDGKTGQVKNQITRGEWLVRTVLAVDAKARQVWFLAGGLVPGQDPYHVHWCRINFDGTSLVRMTEGDGTHECRISPDRRFLIDRMSRVDLPPVITLRRTEDGKAVCELERADVSRLLQTGWRFPERFVAKGRDNQTDIHGIIVRPTHFNALRNYPVIEHIYAGPQGAFVPKNFGPQEHLLELAELGFVVVMIDGMGTSQRSKAFHDVCWQNLGDAGLPDRVRWIKAAAAKHSHLDISRVGIYGVSAGGQNALGALLTHGDFYRVAVADCGCHDNRMDKIWWNEQWMGWPVGPHYAAQSNVTLAPRLQGKLLLMVGEMDRNVDPASTMQVANALIKANKDFDLFVMPGEGHGVSETPYGKRKLQDFFVRHLLGREPRRAKAATH